MNASQSDPGSTAAAPAALALGRVLHPAALLTLASYTALILLGHWALQHVLPDTLTLSAFGHAHQVTHLHARLIDRLVEIGFLLPGVFFVEYLFQGWQGCSVRDLLVARSASLRSDMACYLLVLAPGWTFICGALTFGVAYLSGEGVRRVLSHILGMQVSLADAPAALQVGVLFMVYTLCDYWSHRLDHSRLFWPLHRFHHAAEDFSVLTASRVHPAAFTGLIIGLPLALLGPSPWALVDVGIVVAVIRLIIHSRISSNFGWFGNWVVLSPLHHRLHHSLNRMPINMGLIPVWDRLFGTWRDAPATVMKIGTVKPYRHGAWVGPDIWRDYCEFWAGAHGVVRRSMASLATSLRVERLRRSAE